MANLLTTRTALIAGMTLGAMTIGSTAIAQEWVKEGANGGSVVRTYDEETGVYTSTKNRVGPEGATRTVERTCLNGEFLDRCRRSGSTTNAEGQTVSGERFTKSGEYRTRSVRQWTSADGTTDNRFRRWLNR